MHGIGAMARTLSIVLLLAGLAMPAAAAQRVYRYEGEDGSYVYTTQLPPEAVRRGYDVLDTDGRVGDHVEGELTPEQRERRQAKLEAERAREERLARDRELLRMYSSPEDVERAMERRLASIEGAIETARANIRRVETRKRNLERRAARLERGGRPVPQELVGRIEAFEDDIAERKREIEARKRELERTRERYRADKRRVRQLLAGDGG